MTELVAQKEVQIPGGAKLTESGPLVIIGPNGVGKTRLGVLLTQANDGDRIAALRNVEISDIPMMRFEQASSEVRSALQQVLSQHWRQSFELQNLLSEILAEDREAAVQYREMAERSKSQPEKKLFLTRLRRIVDIWNDSFSQPHDSHGLRTESRARRGHPNSCVLYFADERRRANSALPHCASCEYNKEARARR